MKEKVNSYTVEITESLGRCIIVSAASELEAIEKAAREYKNQRIVLDAEDFVSVDFNVRERRLRNG